MASRKEITNLINSIKNLQDEIDEFLTDKFADLEMGLDTTGIKELPEVFSVFDRLSDRLYPMNNDFKILIKILKYLEAKSE